MDAKWVARVKSFVAAYVQNVLDTDETIHTFTTNRLKPGSSLKGQGMTFLKRREFSLLAGLVGMLAAAASGASPWDSPYADGRTLWHMDTVADGASPTTAPSGPELRIEGQATLDSKGGLHGGALTLDGGHAVARGVDWPGGDYSFEMLVSLRAYPPAGKRACLFEAVDPKNKRRQAAVFVDHAGVLRVEYAFADHTRFRFDETGVIEAPAAPVPLGKWTHVHVCYIGGVQLMVRLSVNGKVVEEQYAGNGANGGKFDLTVGDSAAAGQALTGLVDEVRLARDDKAAAPIPADDWTDPKAHRPLFDDPACFPPRADLTLYAPFDGKVEPMHAGAPGRYEWAKVQDKVLQQVQTDGRKLDPRFVPGMRGQALELGCPLDFAVDGALQADSGAVSFWFKYPDNVKSIGSVFKLGGWGFLLSGGNGLMLNSNYGPLHTRGPAGGGGGWNLGSPRRDRWNHIVLAWRGEWVDAFLNGTWRQSFLVNGGLRPLFEQQGKNLTVGLGDNWIAYAKPGSPAGYIDEYMLFGHYVTEEQVANLYRWGRGEKAVPARASHSRFVPFPGTRKLVIDVDQTLTGIEPGKGLTARLVGPDGKVVCESNQAQLILGWAEIVLQFPLMPAGDYTAEVRQTGADGKAVVADSFAYHHTDAPWLRERAGLTERVLPPWTPVRTQDAGFEVWGRKFRLDGSALPAAVEVRGAELLAGPMAFEIEQADGRTVALRPADAPRKVAAADNRAVFTGSTGSDEINVEVRNETEYDGCSRITLRLAPGPKPAPVKRLTLVIPLRNDGRLLLNAMADTAYHSTTLACAVPTQPGRAFASYILPACSLTTADPLPILAAYEERARLLKEGKPLPDDLKKLAERTQEVSSGNFIPYLWVGTPDKGLCWFADTDEDWVRGDQATPAVEIRRRADGVAELRINFIAAQTTLDRQREITFGLLPTPARPLEPGWRSRYWQRSMTLGFTTNWPAGRSYLDHGCLGAYWGEPYPMDWDRAQWFGQSSQIPGDILTPYMESIGCDPLVVPPYMEFEWRRMPIDDYYRFFPADPTLVDWFAWHYDRYIRNAGLDGSYWDCIYMLASMDIYNHGAWRDSNGDIQSAYYFWPLRKMFRRYRTVLLDAGVKMPWIQVHETGTNKAPAFAYIDEIYDGEGLYQKPDSPKDFMDCWSLDRLTAANCSETLGVPTRFLDHVRIGGWQEWDAKYKWGGHEGAMRTGIGPCLLVDCFHDSFGWPMGDVRSAMFRWGVGENDCDFVGYWKEAFRSADVNVKISAWKRPGTVLLVLVNYAREPVTTEVRFDPTGLLGGNVAGAECGEIETQKVTKDNKTEVVPRHGDLKCSLRADGKQWVLSAGPLAPRDFRLIAIWPKGAPPAIAPHTPQAKPPVGTTARAEPVEAQPAKPAEIPALIAAMKDDEFAFRPTPALVGATARLAATGAPAVEPLIAALVAEDCRTRANAARALSAIGDAKAAQPLAQLLTDDIWRVRFCAQQALERLGAPAVAPLIAALADKPAFAREHALVALGNIHSPEAVEALMKALADDGDGFNRAIAAWALGRIGAPKARPALQKATKDTGFGVAAAARTALAKLPPE